MTVEPARSDKRRWAGGGIILSSVATRYQLGLLFHAGSLILPLSAPTPHGTGGRPRLIGWPDLVIAQIVEQYAGRAMTGAIHRLVHGSVRMFLTLLWSTRGCQVLNTAFIKRLDGTFRSRLAVFGRRTRLPACLPTTVERGMYLIGTLYNFCTAHSSLRTQAEHKRTPAMAAGTTNDIWTVAELLHHRVRPPAWAPPRRRGRRSRALQALIDRWCPPQR
jgi:hypothetical protein